MRVRVGEGVHAFLSFASFAVCVSLSLSLSLSLPTTSLLSSSLPSCTVFFLFSFSLGAHSSGHPQPPQLQFYLDLRTKNTDLLPFCARLRGVAWLQEKGRRPGAKEGLEVVTFAVQLLDVEENKEEVCALCESLSPYLRENTGGEGAALL